MKDAKINKTFKRNFYSQKEVETYTELLRIQEVMKSNGGNGTIVALESLCLIFLSAEYSCWFAGMNYFSVYKKLKSSSVRNLLGL